ncbi:PAN 1 and Zona pellucida domain containing protei n [Trichuris trichiura]|uniref:PAN 1 and Zona pellucida domain containing protei n n=1 Tax=Trichuris trichiura TaxID=36087 RepID=A0A077Z7J7_TRITR|nr:PAN 1 and Zona pellucida domain containing protei n [Trichuris trichiura]
MTHTQKEEEAEEESSMATEAPPHQVAEENVKPARPGALAIRNLVHLFISAVQSSCSSDETPIFILHQGKSLSESSSAKTQSGKTIEECSYMCKTNKDESGGDISCAGYEYDPQAKMCRLVGDVNLESLRDSSGPAFYQKGCVKSNQACSSPFAFELISQKILVGYAKQIVSSASMQECWKSCLESVQSFGFPCQSAMFYPDDKDCILNTETKYQRPDLFVEENKDSVVYFDSNCAGASCSGDSVMQYTKTEGAKIDQGVKLDGLSFLACEYLCTHRIGREGSYNCKSFMYNEASGSCILSDDRLEPMGRSKVVNAPGFDYYEKQCYTSKATCRQVPSFIRHPQHLLVGYAAYVIENVPSVTKCQDICLSPPVEAGSDFKCMSLMYYYDELDCILNTETHVNKPDLFVQESEGFKVDYFSITCLTKEEDQCPEQTSATSIRMAESQLPVTVNNTLQKISGSAASCLRSCRESFPEKCRSMNFDTTSGSCELLFTNRLSTPLIQSRSTDYFEHICIPGTISGCVYAFDHTMNKASSANVIRKLKEPTALPDCLAECLNEGQCQSVNYDNEIGACHLLEEGGATKESATMSFYSKVCGAGEMQTICNFDGMKVKVTKEEPFTGAVFVKMKYDTCRVEVKDSNTAMLHLGFPLSSIEPHKIPQPCPGGACEANLRDKRQAYQQASSYVSSPAPPVPTGAYGQPSPATQVQSAYAAGKPEVHKKGPHKLLPPPTLPIRDCGLVEFVSLFPTTRTFSIKLFFIKNNGTYKAVVVVQTNNLGIPGLVTSMDEIYEVTCDYSSVQAKKVQTEAQLHAEGPVPSNIHPRGKVELSSPVVMNMAGNGQNVLQAKLGEMLELKWEMMVQDSTLDFFVKQCVAERGDSPKSPYVSKEDGTKELVGGSAYGAKLAGCTAEMCPVERAPIVSTLKLIEDGCPTPAVAEKLMPGTVKVLSNSTKVAPLQAFRFDGSRTVRIICQLDICQGSCKPAVCNIGGREEQSYGRKKRNVLDNDIPVNLVFSSDADKIVTEEYIVPKRSSALTTFVIVDPQEEEIVKQAARQYIPHQVDGTDFIDVTSNGEEKVRVCFPKSTFVGVSSFLGMVAITQCIAIGLIMTRRSKLKKGDRLM